MKFMKTQLLRVSMAALVTGSLVFCVGCQEDKAQAQAQVPLFTPLPVVYPAAVAEAPGPTAVPASAPTPAEPPAPKVVQTPTPPDDIQASPALAEVIKLVHSGVSEEVILAYVSSAPRPFNVNSDQIVYLNDLGVSTTVVTSLLQHDASLAGKSGAALPPSVAVTTPATNVYPGGYVPPPNAAPEATEATHAAAPAAPAEQPVSTSYFYGSLSPYGSWIDVDGYGRCWQPTVAVVSSSWRPYSDRGHWIWSDCGWYWYSDYSWGWAPFHYGRWCSGPRIGWFWVPDTCWGPSWVSWRYTSSHCGWAPLPPAARFVSGVGFSYHGGSVGFGFEFGLTPSVYTFVPVSRFHDRNFHNYAVSGHRATSIYQSSTVVNNYVVQNNTVINNGFGVDRVAKATGHRIPPAAIRPAAHVTTATGKSFRHEQLENNGAAITVVRPNLAVAKSDHVAAPQQPASPDNGSRRRFSPVAKTDSATPSVTSKSVDTAPPVVKPRHDAPVNPVRRQEIPRTGASTFTPDPAPTVKPVPASTADVANKTPQTRSTLIPPVGQRPSSAQPPQLKNAPSAPNPTVAARPDVSKVHPEPGIGRAANPRVDGAIPSQDRRTFASPRDPTPARPAPSASPSYRAEPPRNPIIRGESGRAPASNPSASSAAPARGSSEAAQRSGGRKKD